MSCDVDLRWLVTGQCSKQFSSSPVDCMHIVKALNRESFCSSFFLIYLFKSVSGFVAIQNDDEEKHYSSCNSIPHTVFVKKGKQEFVR